MLKVTEGSCWVQLFVWQQLRIQEVICVYVLCSEKRKESNRLNQKNRLKVITRRSNSNCHNTSYMTYITSRVSSTATSSTTSTPTTKFLLTAWSKDKNAVQGIFHESMTLVLCNIGKLDQRYYSLDFISAARNWRNLLVTHQWNRAET